MSSTRSEVKKVSVVNLERNNREARSERKKKKREEKDRKKYIGGPRDSQLTALLSYSIDCQS